MAWTLTTGLITQTGTETLGITENTGLSGLTGVTYSNQGLRHIYTIASGTRMDIVGTLNQNTEISEIVMLQNVTSTGNPCVFKISPGGIYNFGVLREGGNNEYTDGIGLRFANSQINGLWFGGGQDGNGGTFGQWLGLEGTDTVGAKGGILNINGGRMAGRFNVGIGRQSELNNTVNAKWLVDDHLNTAGQEWLDRYLGGTFNTTDFTKVGGSISIIVDFSQTEGTTNYTFAGTRTYTLSRVNAGIAYWNQSFHQLPTTGDTKDNYVTLRNINFVNNIIDTAPYNTSNSIISGVRTQNSEQGSGIKINGGEVSDNKKFNNAGTLHWGTRQIETNFKKLSDQTNAQGSIYMQDIERYDNLEDPITEFQTDSALTYFGTFNGSLTSWLPKATTTTQAFMEKLLVDADQNEVCLYQHSNVRDGTAKARGTVDVGLWRKDIMGNNDTPGEDQFNFHFWSYENNYIGRLNTSLAGRNTFTFNENTIADPAITLSRSAALTLNTSTGTNLSIFNNGIIKMDTNLNLDQLYDLVKIKKEQDRESIQIPTTSTLSLNSSNGVVTFLQDPEIGSTNILTIGSTNTGIVMPNLDLSKITLADQGSFEGTTSITNLPLNINGTIKGTYTETTSTSTDRTFTFDRNSDVSELVLIFNGSGNITIFRKASSDFDTTPTISGGGSIIYDPDNATQFIIPSALPTGRCLLKNTSSGTIEFEGIHTTGTETLLGKFNNSSTHNSNFTLYYLANAVTTGSSANRVFYLPSIIIGSNDNTSNNSVFPTNAEHSDLLTSFAENATPGLEESVISMTNHNSTTAKITIGNSASRPLATANTLRTLLLARETIDAASRTYIKNVGDALEFQPNTSTSGRLIADFPFRLTLAQLDRIIINGVTILKTNFTLTNFDFRNSETATITFNDTLANLGLPTDSGGIFYAHFQNQVTITDGGHSLYLRLLANVDSLNDLILPAPRNETQIDPQRFTLRAVTQQQISAVIDNTNAVFANIDSLASNTDIKSVLIFPNPAGLSLGQLESGITDNPSIKNINDSSIYTAGEQNNLGVRNNFDQTKTYTKSDITN